MYAHARAASPCRARRRHHAASKAQRARRPAMRQLRRPARPMPQPGSRLPAQRQAVCMSVQPVLFAPLFASMAPSQGLLLPAV
eukprot:83312-Chlamydomonas_euryale.AAC.11